MSKTFTLEEAHMLLPVLSDLMQRAREAAIRANTLESEMQDLSQRIFLSGGLHVDVTAASRRRAEREKSTAEARSAIEEIEGIGVQVAEIEGGGLEFPYLLEGRTVLLCWKLGEDRIREWRESEDESEVRREMDDRFGRRDGSRLN